MNDNAQLLLSTSLLLTALSHQKETRWYHIVALILTIFSVGVVIKEDIEQLQKL